MKFLKKINFDSKAINQDLRELNDSSINAVVEYQQTIFELKEDIEMQREEIERLQKIAEERDAMHRDVITAEEYAWNLKEKLKIAKSEAIREFAKKVDLLICINLGGSNQGYRKLSSEIKYLVKEMVGEEK